MVTAFVAETISHPLLCDRVYVFVQMLEGASCNYGQEVVLAHEKLHQSNSESRKQVLIHHSVQRAFVCSWSAIFLFFFFFSSLLIPLLRKHVTKQIPDRISGNKLYHG